MNLCPLLIRKPIFRITQHVRTCWLPLLIAFLPTIGISAQNDDSPAYRVVYTTYASGSGQHRIWTMNSDGAEKQLLAIISDSVPSISPDGRHIAYFENPTGEQWDLRVVAIGEGEVPTFVTQNHWAAALWSPGGDRLLFYDFAYDVFYHAIGDLLVVDADGANAISLARDEEIYPPPVWSPDGSVVLFTSRSEDVETLYAINADGTNLRALHSDIPCFICDPPRWTPDGQFIIFMDYPDLYRMDATCIDEPDTCDDTMQRLTGFDGEYNAVDVYHSRYGQPFYSIASDSTFLVYTFGYRREGGGIDIASMPLDADGWENRPILIQVERLSGAMLSPDNSLIFFNEDERIYRMSVDGSDLLPLVRGNLYGFIP